MNTKTEDFEEFTWKKPYIQVLPLGIPSPIFAFALAPRLHQIEVPSKVLSLPFNKEISHICRLYRKHRKKFGRSWQSGKGFVYHRNKDETLVFDRECHLLEVSQDSSPRVLGYFKIGG